IAISSRCSSTRTCAICWWRCCVDGKRLVTRRNKKAGVVKPRPIVPDENDLPLSTYFPVCFFGLLVQLGDAFIELGQFGFDLGEFGGNRVVRRSRGNSLERHLLVPFIIEPQRVRSGAMFLSFILKSPFMLCGPHWSDSHLWCKPFVIKAPARPRPSASIWC